MNPVTPLAAVDTDFAMYLGAQDNSPNDSGSGDHFATALQAAATARAVPTERKPDTATDEPVEHREDEQKQGSPNAGHEDGRASDTAAERRAERRAERNSRKSDDEAARNKDNADQPRSQAVNTVAAVSNAVVARPLLNENKAQAKASVASEALSPTTKSAVGLVLPQTSKPIVAPTTPQDAAKPAPLANFTLQQMLAPKAAQGSTPATKTVDAGVDASSDLSKKSGLVLPTTAKAIQTPAGEKLATKTTSGVVADTASTKKSEAKTKRAGSEAEAEELLAGKAKSNSGAEAKAAVPTENARLENTKSEITKPEGIKSETTKVEPSKVEAGKADHVRNDMKVELPKADVAVTSAKVEVQPTVAQPAVTSSNTPFAVNEITATKTAGSPLPMEPFKQVVQLVTPLINRGNGDYRMTMILQPEELGSVEVQIRMANGQISMQMNSDNAGARQALQDSMKDLKASLESAGLSTGALDVGTGDKGDRAANSQHNNNGRSSNVDGEVTDEDQNDFFRRLATAGFATTSSATAGDGPLDVRV